jgi:hypothetical protein
MPKSPNYQFERRERDRLKAIKVAEKAAAKREQQARAQDDARPTDVADSDSEKM